MTKLTNYSLGGVLGNLEGEEPGPSDLAVGVGGIGPGGSVLLAMSKEFLESLLL